MKLVIKARVAALAVALFTAAPALADDMLAAAQVPAAATGITVCTDNYTQKASFSAMLNAPEIAIMVKNSAGKVVVGANNRYDTGDRVKDYWLSALPMQKSIDEGCNTYYFMVMVHEGYSNPVWTCARPVISEGPKGIRDQKTMIISGSFGSVPIGSIILGNYPNAVPTTVTTCPEGNAK